MPRLSNWSRNALIALFLSYLVIIPVAWVLVTSQVGIDTDLRSLSPDITKNLGLKSVINDSASIAEKRIQFVFMSRSEDQLEDAMVEFENALFSFESLNDPSIEELQAAYSETLKQYPRNFLTEEDAIRLKSDSNAELISERMQTLYGAASTISLIPIQDDPLGLLNNFLFSVIEKIQPAISSESDADVFVDGVTFEVSDALNMTRQQDLVGKILDVQHRVKSEYPDVEIYGSGVIFFAEEAAAKSKRDVSVISSISLIATVLLLLFIFKSARPLLLPIISIVSGVLTASVVCAWVFGEIHILTIVFGSSLIGVVVDYSLHYFYFRCFASEIKKQFQVYKALLFSLFTSVIGYAALSFSGLSVLNQVAIFSIVGLSASWLAVVALGECLSIKNQNINDRYLSEIVGWGIRAAEKAKEISVVWFFVIAAILLFAIVFNKNAFNDSPRLFFDFSDTRIDHEKVVSEYASSFEPASFVLVRGKTSEELYQNIDELRSRISKDGRLFGVDDLFPSPAAQKRNFELSERVYQSGLGESVLKELGFASTQSVDTQEIGEPLLARENKFQFVDAQSAWPEGNTSMPRLWFEDGDDQFALFMIPKDVNMDGLKLSINESASIQFFSTIENTEHALKQLRRTATSLLVLACLFIYVLVALRYRSLRAGLIVCVPVASIVVTYAAIQWLQGINLFHTMALFLVLGLGMDYVIFAREMSAHSNQTLRAITLSCVTSLMAFGLLAFSSMPVVQSFGLAVLLGNSCNLVGTYILSALSQAKGDLQDVADF